jgi:hypothetical protein
VPRLTVSLVLTHDMTDPYITLVFSLSPAAPSTAVVLGSCSSLSDTRGLPVVGG